MLSIEQIRKIEERRKRLEESQPSKEEKIQTLREQIREFEKSERELEQRKRDNPQNSELIKKINSELENIMQTYDDIDEEISHLNHKDPTIDDVFECIDDTIEKVLPILLQIINDHIRTRILDPSDEITVVDVLMKQTAQYPEEWSKLIGILFKFPRSQDDDEDDEDDYWVFRKRDPRLEAQKERKKKKEEEEAKQYMGIILSQLHRIFFQDENRPEVLSDFGIFLTLAITNCDESGFILNNHVDSYDLLSDFVLESSNCDISEIFLEQRFQIIFFKGLSHPIIKQYLEENIIPERKHWSFLGYVSNIESFLCNVADDCINMKNFPEIVSSLEGICDILDV